MTRTIISLVVFLAGLAVVGWIGAGYIGTNALALTVIALIGVVYLTGAVELQRYQRGTDTLSRAVGGLTVAPSSLDSWLSQLQPSLRGATRLRIEGQRVALPGPTLTPYLVGLLVLLGMLGTFLGMVATLRGTGIALESASDLQAIRASLATPVKGLGFAFGTSVAGVATSAALGLLATLCRRSRIEAAQQLDSMIATTLRPYSQNHQGEQTYKLLQQQAEAMPVLVDRLQSMMAAMEKHSVALHDRLAASQDAFYGRTETAYAGLASSLEHTLKQSVVDSARVAGEAIQPAVQATLAGLARETSAWQDTLAIAIRQQLESLSGRFEATTSSVADIWNQALAQQQQANSKLADDNQRALTAATDNLAQRASALLQSVDQSHAELQSKLATHDQARLETWKAALDQLAAGLNTSLQGTTSTLHAALSDTTSTLHASVQGIASSLDASLKDTTSALRQEWVQASTQATERQQAICETLAQTAQELTAQTQAHARDTITEVSQLLHNVSEAPKAAAAVITELRQSHEDLQAKLIAQDQQRLDNWKASLDHIASTWNTSLETTAGSLTASLETTAGALNTSLAATAGALSTSLTDTASTLRQEWVQASTQATERQQAICETLAQTAQELTAQTQAHARDTITEVSQLLHNVSEAPKAAAAVITELRQSHEDLQAKLIAQDQQRLDNWKASLDHVASTWNTSLETTAGSLTTSLETTAGALSTSLESTAQALHASLEKTTSALNTSMQDSATSLAGTTSAVSAALENTAATLSASLTGTTSALHASVEGMASSLDASLKDTASALREEWAQTSAQAVERQQSICETLAQTAQALTSETQAHARDTITEVSQLLHTVSEAPKAAASVIVELRQSHEDLQQKLIAQDEQRLNDWKASLDHIASTWNTSLQTTAQALHSSLETTAGALGSSLETTATALSTSLEKTTHALNASMEDTAASLSASLEGTTSTLTVTLENTASTLHNSFDDIASSMNVSLENTAYTLRQEWEQASTQAAHRQQEICDTLSQTAQELSSHTQTQARDTIAEVAQLVQTAAEAPRAAASVISELRQKLSDGMARDNELLEERNRLMETLSTLLDAVNHASTQQRDAVDSLISHSSELLERVGAQFTDNVQAETGKLTDAASNITGSAVEVASLGEAFGTAVQIFSQSNDKLVEHLQRIEAALDKSMARSDEQLAYYVAQAREVVDLSVMSQKQIIEDLQLLASQQAPANNEASA